jgi:Zn-dependent peptidase ImmA (M78 family)
MDINKKRIGYCRDMARKVLHDCNMMRIPIPVDDVVKHYGFRVALLDQPPDKFSGILHRDKKAIGINKHHHPVRQRFSLSHELGHYFLDHPDASEEIPDEEGMANRQLYEAEADEFAAELLMPRELLKAALKESAGIEILRTKFQVSRHVVAIQLSKHGFLMKL